MAVYHELFCEYFIIIYTFSKEKKQTKTKMMASKELLSVHFKPLEKVIYLMLLLPEHISFFSTCHVLVFHSVIVHGVY